VAPVGTGADQLDRTSFRLWVEDTVSGERTYNDTVFNGRPR